jgi:hypothetical protein
MMPTKWEGAGCKGPRWGSGYFRRAEEDAEQGIITHAIGATGQTVAYGQGHEKRCPLDTGRDKLAAVADAVSISRTHGSVRTGMDDDAEGEGENEQRSEKSHVPGWLRSLQQEWVAYGLRTEGVTPLAVCKFPA